MFEKCGLRDIFVRIGKLKLIILILVIIGAAVGALLYTKDLNSYNNEKKAAASAEERKMFSGYAYYYVYGKVAGSDTTASKQSRMAATYVKIFKLRSTSSAIYDSLTENHDNEELASLINKEEYPDGHVGRYTLYGKAYSLRSVSGGSILALKVQAETAEMRGELLKICREKLVKIAKSIPDSSLRYQGRVLISEDANVFPLVEEPAIDPVTGLPVAGTEDDVTGEESTESEKLAAQAPPSISIIIIGAVIGLLAGIILAIFAAIFRPSINRASDFEFYGVVSLGMSGKAGISSAARLILKRIRDNGADKLVLVSTLGKDKRVTEFCANIKGEIEKAGAEGETIEVVTALQPEQNGASSDECEAGGLILAVERKGISKHYIFDNMKHYIEVIGKEVDSALLLS